MAVAGQKTRAGYTLIEIAVVITLMALITGVVAVRVTPEVSKARNGQAIDQLLLLERQTRDTCRRNRHRGYLKYSFSDQSATSEVDGTKLRTIELPSSLELKGIATQSGTESTQQVDIFIGPNGETETYAILMSGNETEEPRLIAGITGKPIALESNDEAKDFFSKVWP